MERKCLLSHKEVPSGEAPGGTFLKGTPGKGEEKRPNLRNPGAQPYRVSANLSFVLIMSAELMSPRIFLPQQQILFMLLLWAGHHKKGSHR